MDLILWRHADAFDISAPPGRRHTSPAPRGGGSTRERPVVDSREVEDDLERALTPKGERQAARIAEWLNRQLPAGVKVLASPARRTQQTAAALDRKVKTVAELAPDGTVEGLLHAARWPDAREGVLVVGHQPTLGLTASYLLAGQPLDWPLRKGGVWWLRSREREGLRQVVLHAVISPDLV